MLDIHHYTVRLRFVCYITTFCVYIFYWGLGHGTAAPFTWDGGGTDDNWTTSVNWNTDTTPANDGTDDLTFNGATRTTPAVDTPWSVSSVTFNDTVTAGAFTISGSDITFSAVTGITNSSAAVQTISANLIAPAAGLNVTSAAGDLTLGGGIDLAAGGGATLTFDGAQNTAVSGAITGINASVVKNGTGILTLDGPNTFIGTLTLNAGTLVAGPNSEMSPSAAVTLAGGTFQNNTGMVLDIDQATTISGDVTFAGADAFVVTSNVDLNAGTRAVTVTNTDEVEISGVITNGGVAKDGAGFLILAGNNTYAGGSTLNGGVLGLASDNALGTGALIVSDGTTIVGMDANRTIANAISVTGNFTIADDPNADPSDLPVETLFSGNVDLNGATRTLTVTVAEEVEFDGVVSNGGLTIDGTGLVILTGDNTYAGGTTLNGATLGLAHDNALGTGGVTIGVGTILAPLDANRTIVNTLSATGDFTISSDPNADPGDPTFDLDLTGGLDLSADVQITVTTNMAGRITGAITESGGSRSLTKAGPGQLVLGATNTYTGTTTVSDGNLTVQGGNAIADTAAVVLADTAGVNLTLSASETIGSLAGGGVAGGQVDLGANTLTVGDASDTVFAGVISGTGGLVKQGVGQLTLSAANTYSGTTSVNAGTLALGDDQALGTGGLTIGNGSTLRGVGAERDISNPVTVTGDFTLTGDSTLDFHGTVDLGGATRTITVGTGDDSALTGVISNGGLVKQGSGILIIDGNNTYTGTTTLSGGVLGIGNDNALGTGSVTIDNGTSLMAVDANRTVSNALTINGDFSIIEDTESGPFDLILASDLALTADRQVTIAGGATATLTGAISGTGGLTKEGTGTLTLTGINTYTGTTTVSNGTLAVNGANAIDDTGAVVLADVAGATLRVDTSQTIGSLAGGGASGGNVSITTGTLTVGDASNTVYAGVVSGAGGILKQGSGTLTLQNANTYTGDTTLSAGTLGIANNAALGTGTLTVGNATTIHGVGADRQIANNVVVTGDFTVTSDDIMDFSGTVDLGGATRIVTLGTGGDSALMGVVSNGGINKQGSGLLILEGNNTYADGTTLTGGTLGLAHDNALGSGGLTIEDGTTVAGLFDNRNITNAVTVNGNFTVNGDTDPEPGDPAIEMLFAGSVDLNAATRTITVNNDTLAEVEFSGVISNGGLVKEGPGLLILTGDNTYAGGTTLNTGSLGLAHDNALGTGGLTIANGTTLVGLDANRTVTNTLTVNGDFTIAGDPSANPGDPVFDLTLSGDLALAADRQITVTSSATGTLTGIVSGTGGLTKDGAGTLTLGGANTYTGTTTINDGTLIVNTPNAISDSGAVILADTVAAALTLNTSQTVGSLSGGGVSGGNVNLAANTLTVGDASNTTFAGVLSGTGSLVKQGSGSLTLGGINTYTGSTTVSAGVLILDGANAISDSGAVILTDTVAAALTLNTNQTIGSLSGGGASGGNVDLGANTLTVGDASDTTFAGVLSGTGSLVKQGSGSLTLSGTNTYTGSTHVNAGTVTLDGGAAIADTGEIVLADTVGATLTLSANETIGSLSGGGGSGGNVNLGANTLTVGDSNDTTYSGVVSGTGSLTKQGTGQLTLQAANTYSGATTVNGGTLGIGHNGALGTGSLTIGNGTTIHGVGADRVIANPVTVAGAFTISNDNALDLAGGVDLGGTTRAVTLGASGDSAWTGVVSNGGIDKQGTGVLILEGANTYAGGTTLTGGTLGLAHDSALGTGDLTVNDGTTLRIENTNHTIANGLNINGDFTVTSDSLAPPVVLTLTSGFALAADRQITVSGQANLILSGVISESVAGRTLTIAGDRTVTLSGVNTHTGGTTLSGGTLLVGHDAALGTGALTLATGSAFGTTNGARTLTNAIVTNDDLAITGTDDLTLNGAVSGSGGLVKQGAGILTLGGTNTYAGTTTVSGGVLVVNGGNAIADTGAVTLADTAAVALTLGASETIGSLAGGGAAGGHVDLGAHTLTVGDVNDTTHGGVISGTGNLVKQGAGVLTLTGANTFTGGVNHTAGTLKVGHNTALGTGGLTLADGTAIGAVQTSGTADTPIQISNDLTIASSFTINGDRDLALTDDLPLGSNLSVTVTGTGNGILAGVVSGTFELTKLGAGTLELSGANTYTGDTHINAGILLVTGSIDNSTVILGGGQLELGPNGSVSGNLGIGDGSSLSAGDNDKTIANDLDITGDFDIEGANDLTLTGTIDLMGAVRQIAVQDPNNTTTIASVVSGTGGVTKAGNGTLELNGANTYSGGTAVNAGTLVISGSVAGSTTIAGGTLALANDNALGTDLTVDGGNLESRGGNRTIPDTVTLNVNADFGVTGDDDLEIAADVALAATRTITSDSTGDTVISGVISGGGGLTKAGTGRMVLSGTNTYTGDTAVDAGTLVLNGAVAGDVMVNAAGMLEGAGMINGNVVVSGVFNAGNSPGTIVIGGNMTLNASSTTVVEIASVSLADFYDVGGIATLDGTLSVIQLPGYTPKDGDTFTIIDADGGVSGTFATLSASPAALSYSITYNANDVVINVTAVPYANAAVTENQTAVAAVMDTIRLTATGDWTTVTSQLNQLTPAGLQTAMDQIVPEEIGALSNVSFGGAGIQAGNVNARLTEVRTGARGTSTRNLQLANLSQNVQDDLTLLSLATSQSDWPDSLLWNTSDSSWGLFIAGAGTFGEVDRTSTQSGYDFRTGGMTFGIDRRVDDQLVLGFMAGIASSDVDIDSDGGHVDVNSAKFGIYGTYFDNGFYVNGMIGGGYHAYESDRSVQFGAINRTASSDPDAWEFNAMIGAGYQFNADQWRIEPTGSVLYSRLAIDGYSESGAGALNLVVDRQTPDSLLAQIGVRVSTLIEDRYMQIIPEFRALFQHEFEDQSRQVTARFATGGGGAFGFNTTDIGSDSLVLGTGFTFIGINRTSFYINYNAEVGRSDYVAHHIRGGVRLDF